MSGFAWTCAACGRDISGPYGRVHVRAYLLLRPSLDGESSERWVAHHDDCLPDLEDIGYEIDIDRLRTPSGIAWWTEHLSGKGWYLASGWREFVAGQVGVDVTPMEHDLDPAPLRSLGDRRTPTLREVLEHREPQSADVLLAAPLDGCPEACTEQLVLNAARRWVPNGEGGGTAHYCCCVCGHEWFTGWGYSREITPGSGS